MREAVGNSFIAGAGARLLPPICRERGAAGASLAEAAGDRPAPFANGAL